MSLLPRRHPARRQKIQVGKIVTAVTETNTFRLVIKDETVSVVPAPTASSNRTATWSGSSSCSAAATASLSSAYDRTARPAVPVVKLREQDEPGISGRKAPGGQGTAARAVRCARCLMPRSMRRIMAKPPNSRRTTPNAVIAGRPVVEHMDTGDQPGSSAAEVAQHPRPGAVWLAPQQLLVSAPNLRAKAGYLAWPAPRCEGASRRGSGPNTKRRPWPKMPAPPM